MTTGNIGNRETMDYLKSLSNNFVCVKGETDDNVILNLKTYPDHKIIQIGKFKIGIVHGH